ncbi:hypothetical protein BJV82DRAFT_524837 [Fennellomyces sp. T-0311]|nr:hypothetical protein BJV82DRAFT_524837 [Fennellomyces sp. T-0311]
MVRFKVRWILFELVQDPVIDKGQVVFPRTAAKLCDDDLNNCIHSAMTIDYGDFGQGMARSLPVLTQTPGTIVGVQKQAIIRDRDIYLQLQTEAQAKGRYLATALPWF